MSKRTEAVSTTAPVLFSVHWRARMSILYTVPEWKMSILQLSGVKDYETMHS